MRKRELSKYDFERIVRSLNVEAKLSSDQLERDRLEHLAELFASAFTGWLEIEED